MAAGRTARPRGARRVDRAARARLRRARRTSSTASRRRRAIWRDLREPARRGSRRAARGAALGRRRLRARAAEERLRELGARGYRADAVAPPPARPGRPRRHPGARTLPRAARRRAGPAHRLAVAEGARPPEDPRRASGPPDAARLPDGGAVARAETPERSATASPCSSSTVRTVLDPEKRFDADHFIAADRSSVWLQSENLAVDVERFLDAASEALAALRDGSPDAVRRLAAAEAAYSGDFLEEDAYEEWALALREEARAAYTEVARALAEERIGRGRRRCRDALLPARPRARPVRRACAPRPGRRARERAAGTARHGALPGVLRAHGLDRRRVGSVHGRGRSRAPKRALRPLEPARPPLVVVRRG